MQERANPYEKLLQLWEAKRSEDRLPARRDFSFADLGPWMGDVGLVDVVREPDIRYRFRLVGSNFTWLEGPDITGRFADEIFGPDRQYIIDEYDEVIRTRAPLIRQRPVMTKRHGAHLLYRKLILPLAGDGTTIDMLMVHLHPETDIPRKTY